MSSTEKAPRNSRILDRAVARVVNSVEVARYGGLRTEEAPAPFDVVAHEPVYRLRHYYPEDHSDGEPVLLIPPLMQVAEVWDVSPATSAVAQLRENGLDPWVVDFGDPETEPGGKQRNFSDHVLAVADAIGRVREATGRDVHLGGYSQGGVFCYVSAAYRNCDGVASIFVLGSPLGGVQVENFVPENLFWDAVRLQGRVLGRTGLPRWAVTKGFNWSNPQRTIKADIDYLLALHDRESLLPREPQRKYLKRGAWIGWPGPAITELLEILSKNRLLEGGAVIGDRAVGLSDLDIPILIFVGEVDSFASPASVRRIVGAAPKATVYECSLPVGHFGLPVSSHAKAKTWPGVSAWVRWTTEHVPLPDYIHPLSAEDIAAQDAPSTGRGLAGKVTYTLGAATQAAITAPRVVAQSGQQLAATVRDLSSETAAQLPRLVRLQRMGPNTRVSYAGMLDDAAKGHAEEITLLFEHRAHTHAAVKARVDNVVRGLVSVGIRRGEHVGVLMDVRPAALVTVAALNRIGAVAVMMRPGQDSAPEARLGQVTKIVCDPENTTTGLSLGVPVFVLGGGAGVRQLPPEAVDLERIDPAAVELPAWYVPNPGRARDLAFVLFSGSGAQMRADRISNGRWATSALAASSAAALTPGDTVYSISPLHHPSGLLLTTAATTASRARLAMASGFDPDSFWSEVRRYGVTVVPYTWTMLHRLVSVEPHPEERGHRIRLFVGSGMPAGLWRRVEQRFGPAAVLELYASTRSDAILGNVADRKLGAAGRPLPGTPKVRVVRVDTTTGQAVTGSDGFADECEPTETGLLLVETDAATHPGNDVPLRGMFKTGDAWLSTGDLFRADRDGDLWYVDSLAALISTDRGIVSPRSVENALGELDAVDLAACYKVQDKTAGTARAVAAVTLRDGAALDAAALNSAFAELEPGARPDRVHVLDAMPLTSWFRPSLSDLQARWPFDDDTPAWQLNRRTGRYQAPRQTGSTSGKTS
jgi:putative long chain acyl-CoA synthase